MGVIIPSLDVSVEGDGILDILSVDVAAFIFITDVVVVDMAILDVVAMIPIPDVIALNSMVDEAVDMFITGEIFTATLGIVLRFIPKLDIIGIPTVDVSSNVLRVGALEVFIVEIDETDVAVILILDVVPALINHKSFVHTHVCTYACILIHVSSYLTGLHSIM